MPKLVINVDHIATLRQARLSKEPDPVQAALLAELGGARGIIVHLREDRRHIQDLDLELLKQTVKTSLHLEMAATREMQEIAIKTSPDMICLVPEKRQELTTEGGLNLLGREQEIKAYLEPLQDMGLVTSLFIDADPEQIKAAKKVNSEFIEIHTGHFADAVDRSSIKKELTKILTGINLALDLGLKVNLGHGLNYTNIYAFKDVRGISEYSIGHSIIARASMVGMQQAVYDMASIIASFPD